MRFDPERVITLADEFAGPRLSGTEGEFRAGRKLAELLADAGWNVEVGEPERDWTPWKIVAATPFGLIWFLILYTHFVIALYGHLPRLRLVVCFLVPAVFGVLWLIIFLERAARRFHSGPIVAKHSHGQPAKRRLVVLTPLTSRAAEWPDIVVFLLGVLPMMYVVNLKQLPPVSGSAWKLLLLAPQLLALMALARGIPPWPVPPTQADNRTGLALLVELARYWPTKAHDRLETWLVAGPGGRRCSRDFRRRITDDIPTIVITLDSVGVGPDLRIAGFGKAVKIARGAADSLWSPHTRGGRVSRGVGLPSVRLEGGRSNLPIDRDVLARAAQLVIEIALRWGRSADRKTAE